MREDKGVKHQQWGIDIKNPDVVKPYKPFIPDKYNNLMELKKLKRKFFFTKVLLWLGAQGFSEEEVSICANITARV